MKDVTQWKELADERGKLLFEQSQRIEALEAALRCVIDNVKTGSYESTGQAIDLDIIETFVNQNVGGQPALDAIARLRR